MVSKNIPTVKLGIIAVSRDCFPIALSTQRRENIVKEYKGEIFNCQTTVENEQDMLKAVSEVKAEGCNALVVFLGNFGPETPETLIAKKIIGSNVSAGDTITVDEYGGELDGLLGFQTGGQSDERQYLAYVEVTEEGIVVTAYQRTEAGDASPKKCADYTAIDSFAIRHEQSQPAEPEAAAKTEEKPAAESGSPSAHFGADDIIRARTASEYAGESGVSVISSSCTESTISYPAASIAGIADARISRAVAWVIFSAIFPA